MPTANCGLPTDHDRPTTLERPLLVSSPITNEKLRTDSPTWFPSAGGEDTKPAARAIQFLLTAHSGLPTGNCRLAMSGPRLESRGNSIFLADSQEFRSWNLLKADCGLETADCRLKIAYFLTIPNHPIRELRPLNR